MRSFNTEGQCIPELHYMVNIDSRLKKIKTWIKEQKYLYMQEGRQYGKTTTLMALEDYIKDEYIVIALDFRGMSSDKFRSEHAFSEAFAEMMEDVVREQPSYVEGLDAETMQSLKKQSGDEAFGLVELFRGLKSLCMKSERPVVLMIDEVDSAANNQVFLDFLALLRMGYLKRNKVKTFQSVILAGVYDIKNLKGKLRPEEEHDKINSPWNIAAKFAIDMNFSAEEIAGMLEEYEADHHTGMDVSAVAQALYAYTSGYPYLVSVICKMLDEEVPNYPCVTNWLCIWSERGISEAVKALLKLDVPLFGSLSRQMYRFPDLKEMIRNVIFRGQQIPFSREVESINIGLMFGYLKERENRVTVSNRIFEMLLQNMFITEA